MEHPVKYRKHIESVWRVKPEERTRLDKVRLDKNERISPFPDAFWHDAIKDITQESVQACPEVWPLYAALSKFHGLAMDNFLLTAGADAAIRHCFETFVSPNDKVFFPDPTFAMVPIYGNLYGARGTGINYDSRLKLNSEDLLASIDDTTSLIICANPNSPTGTYVSNDQLRPILAKARLFRVPVLIDEAYYGFCPHTAQDLLNEYDNLIIARSFSKIAGMAGLRVGYLMGHRDVISLLTRFRPMYEVNSIGIVFALRILKHWDVAVNYANETIQGRTFFSDFLKQLGFPVVDTETNFLHVDFGARKQAVLSALEANNILVRGMLNIPGYQNHTRFSIGPRHVMTPVAEVIRKALK